MSRVNGPERPCYGPTDYEGAGRERYWDLRPEERERIRPQIQEMAADRHAPGGPKPIGWADHAFARGWIAEWRRWITSSP